MHFGKVLGVDRRLLAVVKTVQEVGVPQRHGGNIH